MTYLAVAYAIFCLVPLGVAVSVIRRRRQVEWALEQRRAELDADEIGSVQILNS
ncbi:MAG: hypothetical protein ACP5HS_02915 [Anaerolineae bacterium]